MLPLCFERWLDAFFLMGGGVLLAATADREVQDCGQGWWQEAMKFGAHGLQFQWYGSADWILGDQCYSFLVFR